MSKHLVTAIPSAVAKTLDKELYSVQLRSKGN